MNWIIPLAYLSGWASAIAYGIWQTRNKDEALTMECEHPEGAVLNMSTFGKTLYKCTACGASSALQFNNSQD